MKPLVIVPLIAAVAGCTAVGPEYTRPDVVLTPSYAGLAGQTAPAVLEVGWWRQYRDALRLHVSGGGSPALRRMVWPRSSRSSAAAIRSVRVSCQTIALWYGRPVRRFHTSDVSR